MTTTKRTPLCGPYRAEGNTIKALDHGEWFTIARCDCKRLIPEGNAANAEFLASAPDLLRQRDGLREALQDFVLACDHGELVAGEHCRTKGQTIYNQARAILAETEEKL